jgi:capsule assembly protein Wzi
VPGQGPSGPIYFNARYRSGYTNYGNLLASWIGRQGRGGQAWATYWFTARNRAQLFYRHMEVDRVFLQGGHLNDLGVHSEVTLRRSLVLSSLVQYERWAFPLLASRPRSNVSMSVQLTFFPQKNQQ